MSERRDKLINNLMGAVRGALKLYLERLERGYPQDVSAFNAATYAFNWLDSRCDLDELYPLLARLEELVAALRERVLAHLRWQELSSRLYRTSMRGDGK